MTSTSPGRRKILDMKQHGLEDCHRDGLELFYIAQHATDSTGELMIQVLQAWSSCRWSRKEIKDGMSYVVLSRPTLVELFALAVGSCQSGSAGGEAPTSPGSLAWGLGVSPGLRCLCSSFGPVARLGTWSRGLKSSKDALAIQHASA